MIMLTLYARHEIDQISEKSHMQTARYDRQVPRRPVLNNGIGFESKQPSKAIPVGLD